MFKLEEFTEFNFNKILCLVLDIQEKLQLSPSSKIELLSHDINTSSIFDLEYKEVLSNSEYREKALQYLKHSGVISEYKIVEDILSNGFHRGNTEILDFSEYESLMICRYQITVDVSKFKTFKSKILKIFKERQKEYESQNLPEQRQISNICDIGSSKRKQHEFQYAKDTFKHLLEQLALVANGFIDGASGDNWENIYNDHFKDIALDCGEGNKINWI